MRLLQARKRSKVIYPKAYLFTTARNVTFALFRRSHFLSDRSMTDRAVLSIAEEEVDVAEQVSTKQEVAVLLEAVDALPIRCREIFILRKLQGVSQKEIALRLGLSEQTVQVQTARGTKKCARYLRKHGVVGRFETTAIGYQHENA